MKAFVRADVEGLERLLTEDVIVEMPPMLNSFAGPALWRVVRSRRERVSTSDEARKSIAAGVDIVEVGGYVFSRSQANQ
ncbi:hypothetical protein ACIBSV_09570 [Embleya sp. NPDC050154]|uniref:hypothetical protein n=1 Tax=unclassified Embleya TaxID=2699296 RepID=UPI00378D72FA